MKRKIEHDVSSGLPPWKKRKINDGDMIDGVEHKLSQLNVSDIFNDIFEEKDEEKQSNDSKNEWEVFCCNKLETNLLSSLETERRKQFMGDIVIYESQYYGYKDLVICRGPNTLKIKDTLKKIGFKWNAKKYEWTMNKKWFISDFDLYINDELRKQCEAEKLLLSVFDINGKKKRKEILIEHINIFIAYNKKMNEIIIKTSIDEEEMIKILNKYNYTFSHYEDNEINVYKKPGILYGGHLETWKEYTIFYEWILGFNPNNIEPTPNCITCNAKLMLHKVKKSGNNNGRRFYNCYQCRNDDEKRNYSFIWADGQVIDKVSQLLIAQQLTQPFSQIVL